MIEQREVCKTLEAQIKEVEFRLASQQASDQWQRQFMRVASLAMIVAIALGTLTFYILRSGDGVWKR